jgi:hypothetical protein
MGLEHPFYHFGYLAEVLFVRPAADVPQPARGIKLLEFAVIFSHHVPFRQNLKTQMFQQL